jgi:glycerol-3-phosphate dehydrogenase
MTTIVLTKKQIRIARFSLAMLSKAMTSNERIAAVYQGLNPGTFVIDISDVPTSWLAALQMLDDEVQKNPTKVIRNIALAEVGKGLAITAGVVGVIAGGVWTVTKVLKSI